MKLQTVTGPVAVEDVGLVDGHGHAWIKPPEGVNPDVRLELDDYHAIVTELRDFRAAGGTALVDCQPGGCGRDARVLVRLAEATELYITATTGFHRRKYYPDSDWLWSVSGEEAAAYFIEELSVGMRESGGTSPATTIKVGYEGLIEGQSRALMEAAAEAARQTGAAVLVHTEQGANVEALPSFFGDQGVPTNRLYICHVDKRPDFVLHRDLAQAGALLGYDTFVRPKYNPEQGVWPLIKKMVAAGLAHRVAIGLDLAGPSLWRHCGGWPGMMALPDQVLQRLRAEGMSEPIIAQLTGQNVARHLVWQLSEYQVQSE